MPKTKPKKMPTLTIVVDEWSWKVYRKAAALSGFHIRLKSIKRNREND